MDEETKKALGDQAKSLDETRKDLAAIKETAEAQKKVLTDLAAKSDPTTALKSLEDTIKALDGTVKGIVPRIDALEAKAKKEDPAEEEDEGDETEKAKKALADAQAKAKKAQEDADAAKKSAEELLAKVEKATTPAPAGAGAGGSAPKKFDIAAYKRASPSQKAKMTE